MSSAVCHIHKLCQITTKTNLLKCDRELGLCFRQNDDHGTERTKETCSTRSIIKNLEALLLKWETFLPKVTVKEIVKLKDKHAKCLSGIPKGFGTNKNEALHRKKNEDRF